MALNRNFFVLAFCLGVQHNEEDVPIEDQVESPAPTHPSSIHQQRRVRKQCPPRFKQLFFGSKRFSMPYFQLIISLKAKMCQLPDLTVGPTVLPQSFVCPTVFQKYGVMMSVVKTNSQKHHSPSNETSLQGKKATIL